MATGRTTGGRTPDRARDAQILRAIAEYQEAHRRPPTYAEINQRLDPPYRGKGAIGSRLERLAREGAIARRETARDLYVIVRPVSGA